jgi:hypothetical protein
LVADSILARLRAEARASAIASLTLAAELGNVMTALGAGGVSALAVKGPVTAALCYGDLGLRAFGDLDLLVAPSDVPAACAILASRGYEPQFALSPPWLRHLVRHDHELLFRHADRRRMVDLHWSLLPRGYSFTPAIEGPFLARQTIRVGRAKVPTLGSEATLLFLLLHGIKHGWEVLGWLVDIAQFIRRTPRLDWDAVLGWSHPEGRRRQIDLGLALASALAEGPVPEAVLERGRADPVVDHLGERLARGLLVAGPRARAWIPKTKFSSSYLRAMASTADRLRFLHDVALRPTPLEWKAVPLPAAVAPLHYLVRPARLLWKNGPAKISNKISKKISKLLRTSVSRASSPYSANRG